MPVYVDRTKNRLGRMLTCHMLADTLGELHAMADGIGCPREWFQYSRTGVPHYDIPLFRKAEALRRGAVLIGRRETAALMERIREPARDARNRAEQAPGVPRNGENL